MENWSPNKRLLMKYSRHVLLEKIREHTGVGENPSDKNTAFRDYLSKIYINKISPDDDPELYEYLELLEFGERKLSNKEDVVELFYLLDLKVTTDDPFMCHVSSDERRKTIKRLTRNTKSKTIFSMMQLCLKGDYIIGMTAINSIFDKVHSATIHDLVNMKDRFVAAYSENEKIINDVLFKFGGMSINVCDIEALIFEKEEYADLLADMIQEGIDWEDISTWQAVKAVWELVNGSDVLSVNCLTGHVTRQA